MATRRKIIKIDEELCTGCEKCIPNCPEGALQIIDGKARLVSDLFCDGLGACVGECPEGAMAVEEREAEPYDERKVMENVVTQGPNTIKAHLHHLREHGAMEYFREAVAFLNERGIHLPATPAAAPRQCPGSLARSLRERSDAQSEPAGEETSGPVQSHLANWPIQLKLMPVSAPYLEGARLLLAADCTAFSLGDFHRRLLQGRVLAIACPKLDDAEFYREKLGEILKQNRIESLEVVHMEVPCCFGLVQIARAAVADAGVDTPLTTIQVGVRGGVQEPEREQVNA